MRRHYFLGLAPLVVLLVWFAGGQWALASEEARAWLVLVAVLGVAACLPVPAPRASRFSYLTRLQWFGWAALVGLIAAS
jgi:hypothetical protein